MKTKSLILASLLLLSSCGFSPMYGTYSPTSPKTEAGQALSLIEIDNIPNREGQLLRNDLVDRLNRRGTPDNPLYQLSFGPVETQMRELDLTKDSEATRGQLILSTSMRLIDKATGNILLSRDLSSVSSYNILQSNFATRVTETNAQETAIKDLARQAEQQLVLYFNR